MLKWSSEEEVNKFCAEICSRFNPKFTGSREEIETQSEIAFTTAYSFAKHCELTSEEYLLAFNLAAEGKLKYEADKDGHSETIKIFREIDAIKLNEIKSAYIRYKLSDKQYEMGKESIKTYLSTPPEPTAEEKKLNILESFKRMIAAIKQDQAPFSAIIFYNYAKNNGAFKSFLNNKEYQKTALDNKMLELLRYYEQRQNNTMFLKHEISAIRSFLFGQYKTIPEEHKTAFERLKNLAFQHIKKDLTVGFFKKEIKKNNIQQHWEKLNELEL